MTNYTLAVFKADKNDIQGSFAKAIAFLEKDEKNVLNAFYASDYKFIKKNEPETFEKVKALIEAKRLQKKCLMKTWQEIHFILRNSS